MLRIPERVIEKNLNPVANLQTYPQEQWAVRKMDGECGLRLLCL